MHTSDSFMITIKDCNGCLLAVNFSPSYNSVLSDNTDFSPEENN